MTFPFREYAGKQRHRADGALHGQEMGFGNRFVTRTVWPGKVRNSGAQNSPGNPFCPGLLRNSACPHPQVSRGSCNPPGRIPTIQPGGAFANRGVDTADRFRYLAVVLRRTEGVRCHKHTPVGSKNLRFGTGPAVEGCLTSSRKTVLVRFVLFGQTREIKEIVSP